MDRLVAFYGNEPERLRAVLRLERAVLAGQAGRSDATPVPSSPEEGPAPGALAPDGQPPEPRTRWGAGFYVGGEPLVQRYTDGEVQGLDAVKELRADTLLLQSHGQAPGEAGGGPVAPVRRGRLLLSLQTVGQGWPVPGTRRDESSTQIPAFLRAHQRSDSASERLLLALLARLHEAEPAYLSDPGLPPEVAVAALGPVLGTPPAEAGGAQIALSSGRWLVVARHGTHPVFYRAFTGITDGDKSAEKFRGVLTVAGSAYGGEGGDAAQEALLERGYQIVPENHALVVTSAHACLVMPLF